MAGEPETRAMRRRGAIWRPIAYGVGVPADLTGRAAYLAELAAWQSRLAPGAVFTGLTAASLHGLWLPGRIDALPHFVAMHEANDGVRPIRSRLVVSRHPSPPAGTLVSGVRTAPVADALLACARHLSQLDLLILIDAALHLGLVSRAEIAAAAVHRRKGAPALRRALDRADGRSESAWETVLRALHDFLGVATTPQVDLHDATGRRVARADLLLTGTATLHEYDGGGHRAIDQHRSDLVRDRELLNAGFARRGYTSDVLLYRPSSALTDCERTLGRTIPRSALFAWKRELSRSMLTPAGRRSLAARFSS